ncbi:ALP1-like protein isoform X1 [Tanacetum coccineum]
MGVTAKLLAEFDVSPHSAPPNGRHDTALVRRGRERRVHGESDSTHSNTSDLDDKDDIELIMQAIKHDQSLQQNEAESSRRRQNPINRERDFAEAHGANNDLTVLNNPLLFDDFLDDIAPMAPFEVYGVTFEKGYYLADGIYPQWATFVKSFTVARDEKKVVFKRRQESARKNVERAFGVLQGL